MLAYRDGEAQAFASLYARHKGNLFRFMLRSVKDRAFAEESFQEVWKKLIDARGRYEPQAKFTTWLYTIAHNRMIDHWRKRGLEAVSLDEDDAREPSAPYATQPERRAKLNQSGERLLAALAALPVLQREAFLLHGESGMSVAEIAAATGCGPEAARLSVGKRPDRKWAAPVALAAVLVLSIGVSLRIADERPDAQFKQAAPAGTLAPSSSQRVRRTATQS